MRNTENKREGLMYKNQEFMKEFKMYKNHSRHLRQIKEAFEKDGHKFNNMDDVDNILLLLKAEPVEVSFLDDDDDSGSNQKERKPDIFDNPFFKI